MFGMWHDKVSKFPAREFHSPIITSVLVVSDASVQSNIFEHGRIMQLGMLDVRSI